MKCVDSPNQLDMDRVDESCLGKKQLDLRFAQRPGCLEQVSKHIPENGGIHIIYILLMAEIRLTS